MKPNLTLLLSDKIRCNDIIEESVKMNVDLANNVEQDETPHLIDGIVMTKFDTIDDKVGAAVSMTYVSGLQTFFICQKGELASISINDLVDRIIS